MANKVRYGLENCYFAKATIAADGTATFATPKAFPGAVSLSLDPEGELSRFFADNRVYYQTANNNGYSASLEVALVVDDFWKDILGEKTDSNNGLQYELQDIEPEHFALIFEFNGDAKKTRHVLYNCVATRPSISASTKEETIEPATETLDITATGINITGLGYVVKSRATEDASAYASFFSTVQVPAAATT